MSQSFRTLALYQTNNEMLEYYEAIYLIEHNLSESILSNISSSIKKYIDFFKEIASLAKTDLLEIIKLFKNGKVYKIFKAIGFSINTIVSLYKKGIDTWKKIESSFMAKISEFKSVKKTKEMLIIIDDFFDENPQLKRISGVAVAGLLFYIWTQMSFVPDLESSMDFTDIILALKGSFSLTDLFTSPSGLAMISYLATGTLLGLSMPWPGSMPAHIIFGLIWSSYRLIKPKNVKIKKRKYNDI